MRTVEIEDQEYTIDYSARAWRIARDEFGITFTIKKLQDFNEMDFVDIADFMLVGLARHQPDLDVEAFESSFGLGDMEDIVQPFIEEFQAGKE